MLRKPKARNDCRPVAAVEVFQIEFLVAMFPLAEKRLSPAVAEMRSRLMPATTTIIVVLIAQLILHHRRSRVLGHAERQLYPAVWLSAFDALGTGVAHALLTTVSPRLGAARASATAFLMQQVSIILRVPVSAEVTAVLAALGGAACDAGARPMRRTPATG